MPLPTRHQHLRLQERVEYLQVQKLISQSRTRFSYAVRKRTQEPSFSHRRPRFGCF